MVALVVFTPLFRAGATPLAELVSQLLSIVVLVLVLWSPKRLAITWSETLILALLLLIPALYLLPLPSGWVDLLPGRALYAEANPLLPASTISNWKSLSIYPGATAAAGLALLLPIAIFLGTRTLAPRALLTLVKLLLAVAVLQAILGLVQFGTAQSGPALLAVEGASGQSATGTFANRNHLAGLIEMMLPMALALFFYTLGRSETPTRQASGWRRKAAFLNSKSGGAATVYGIVAVLLLIGIIFTRSRTGIFLGMLGIILSALMFSRRIGGSNVFGPAGTVVALALSFGIAIGLAPVLDRFSISTVGDDARWQVFGLTLQGAGNLFPLGAGPGNFPWVFPPLQPVELGRVLVNRAHNDYLEWWFDLGILGAVLVALVLILYLRQWVKLRTAEQWTRPRFLQAAAGISLLLLAIHEFVDYNLYTPTNQLVFALLAGVFFMPVERLHAVDGERRRKRTTPDLVPRTQPSAPVQRVPADQIENPFRNG